MSICSWGICSSYLQKPPFPIVIFSVWFSFYGGLLHFVYYYFTETKCSTALSACIFLPLLLCSGGVFTLPLQKPQMLFDRPRMDVVLCSNEFDIWSNSLSSIVQGRTMLDSGYRFNRCPQAIVLIYVRILHTAVTGYRRDYFSLITSHIIAYKGLCFISIFLLLFL